MSIEEVREAVPGSDPVANLRAGFLAEAARPAIFARLAETDAQIARLQAERVRLLGRLGDEALWQAELEAERHPGDDPDRWARLQWRSAAMELAAATRLGAETATRQLGEAWTLTQKCEVTLQLLAEGQISFGHAQVIAREVADLEPLAAGAAQELLLPYARRSPVGLFARQARQVLDRYDPQKLADRHRAAYAQRHVRIEGARDGMAWLSAYLQAGDAAVIASGLHNAAEDARVGGDPRTRRQLEADLLTDLLLNGQITISPRPSADALGGADSRDAPTSAALDRTAGNRGARGPGRSSMSRSVRERAPVSVDVLIPAATLAGDDTAPALIPGIGMIDPATARRLVARAPSLRRILTDPTRNAILHFDRKTYRVPAELKRVILLRDQHCRAPGCSRPIAEIDHTIAYATGGITTRGNLAGLCRNHHHLKHETHWGLTQHADGILDWTGPTGRHYRTEPDLILPGEPPPEEQWDPAPFDLPGPDDDPDHDRATTSDGAASGDARATTRDGESGTGSDVHSESDGHGEDGDP